MVMLEGASSPSEGDIRSVYSKEVIEHDAKIDFLIRCDDVEGLDVKGSSHYDKMSLGALF